MPRITPEAAFPWKLRLFFAGAIFLLLGIFLDRRPLVVAAIATLAVGMVLRFLSRKPPPEVHPSWYEDE
jgi:ABC-type branched-subunit amino acid transport system permease subunit